MISAPVTWNEIWTAWTNGMNDGHDERGVYTIECKMRKGRVGVRVFGGRK